MMKSHRPGRGRVSAVLALLLAFAVCAACGDDTGVPDAGVPDAKNRDVDTPDAGRIDAGRIDAGVPDAGKPDAGKPDAGKPDAGSPDAKPKPLSRGLKWVRGNPMFISGLTVTMGAPTAQGVQDYFGSFNATAVHLWLKGLPTAMNGWRKHGGPGTRWVAWIRDDGTSLDNLKVIGGYPAGIAGRIGYQVGDEPQDLAALQKIEAGVKAARKADPNALVYVNFSYLAKPLAQMLQHYCDKMDADVISYDRYSQSNKTYATMALFRSWGLKCGLPYWRYINAYHDVGDSVGITPSDLRWDAYAGLLFGYTGHTWFLYQISTNNTLHPAFFAAQNSFAAKKTALYAAAAQLNTELANLGQVVTQLTSTDVRYIPAIGLLQPPGTFTWKAGAGGDPYLAGVKPGTGGFLMDILVGFFKDDAGERYVMVQNTRHDNGDWPIDNANAGGVVLDLDFAKAPASLDKTKLLTVDAKTGKVGSIALKALGGGKAQVELNLAAGEAVLFKYSTGKGFAGLP
jgi:hypothetical protein